MFRCSTICLDWDEQEGTFTSGERRVKCLHKAQEPHERAMSDWNSMEEIAVRMGVPREKFYYESVWDIWEEVGESVPLFAGINRERLDTPEDLHWSCPSEDHHVNHYYSLKNSLIQMV